MEGRKSEQTAEAILEDIARRLAPQKIAEQDAKTRRQLSRLGDAIAALRVARRWSRRRLSEVSGVEPALLALMENGAVVAADVNAEVIDSLARAFGVNPWRLAYLAPRESPTEARAPAGPVVRLRRAGSQWIAQLGAILQSTVDSMTVPGGELGSAAAELMAGTGDSETYLLEAGNDKLGTFHVSPDGIEVVFAEAAANRRFIFRARWEDGREQEFASVRATPGRDWKCPIQKLAKLQGPPEKAEFECVFEG